MQADNTYLLARIIFDPQMLVHNYTYGYHSGSGQITQAAESLVCENWLSETPVKRGRSNNILYAHNENVLFGYVKLQYALGLDQMTANAYSEVFSALNYLEFPHLIRVWHYLPCIHQEEGKVSRYQLFCRGRNQAFQTVSHQQAIEQRCATTVIGTAAPCEAMFFIATRNPGRPIENIHQANPWEYPGIKDTEKPLFSRAMWSPDLAALFVSGTASIVGHQSVYVDDILVQLEQIFNNFDTLGKECAQQTGVILREFDCLKVYVQPAMATPDMRQVILSCLSERHLQARRIIFLAGDICRQELTVEIEAVLSVQ